MLGCERNLRRTLRGWAAIWIGAFGLIAAPAFADEYAREWGPKVGTQIPVLAAPDQTGAARDLDSLAGENGLLIFINRSADW